MKSTTRRAALVLTITLASANASAQEGPFERYDLEGTGTTAAIARLTHQAHAAYDTNSHTYRMREAARWSAAADLVVLAGYRGDRALRARVAEAVQAPRATLELAILDGLTEVPVTASDDPAEDRERAVRLLSRGDDVDWSRHTGPRRDVLFLGAIRHVLDGPDDPISPLAALANDPCPRRRCAAIYRGLAPEGRRALAALAEAHAALTRIAQNGETGPFLAAIAEDLAETRDVVAATELSPELRIGDDLQVETIEVGGRPARPSLVVVVGPNGFRYGWSPRFRMSVDGLVRVADGEPILPATRAVGFGHAPRPLARPLDAAMPTLAELAAQLPDGAQLAIGCTPETPAHVLSRMLLTMRQAGAPTPALLARASDGSMRTVPLTVVRSHEEIDGPAVKVHVRLGGYTVRGRGHSRVDIPRVRLEESEGWRFDRDRLRSTTRPASRIALSAMGTVDSGELIATAFAIAPSESAITLALY